MNKTLRLIIIGCEYSGTTTLAQNIKHWAEEFMDEPCVVHDHWKYPYIACYPLGLSASPLTQQEQRQLLELSPKLKEMLQRQNMAYHYPDSIQVDNSILVGYHVEDAVYGPLYFGYGLKDEPHGGLRSNYVRTIEDIFIKRSPETTLVLLKANPDVILKRMTESVRNKGILREKDIRYVLERFEEEYNFSLFSNKFMIDTSLRTSCETLDEFKRQFQTLMADDDQVQSFVG